MTGKDTNEDKDTYNHQQKLISWVTLGKLSKPTKLPSFTNDAENNFSGSR